MGLQIIFPNILPQVLIISYGGQVFFNMCIDTDLIKDGETLLPKFYLEELLEMATTFGVSTEHDFVYAPRSPGGSVDMIH